MEIIERQILESISVKEDLLKNGALIEKIDNCAKLITDQYAKGKKVLFAGNGGSAADAQHLAGELVSRFYFDRPALAAIALTTDTSILTAIGNDYGYEVLFERQLKALAIEGDIFIGISTSGNSPNVLKALEYCKKAGIISIGLTGATGGQMAEICDYLINVPSNQTPRIQESHILIGHILCCIVEKNIFGGSLNLK